MNYPDLLTIVDWASWHAFFRAHPEWCVDPSTITLSDDKYCFAQDGYLIKTTEELVGDGIIDREDQDALREAARRVGEHFAALEITEEAEYQVRVAAETAHIARYKSIMRDALAAGNPNVCLSKSGQQVIFTVQGAAGGRRDLSSIPEHAERQMRNAGLLNAS